MRTVQELLSDPEHGLVRERREPQLRMAHIVEDIMRAGGAAFIEAPVATGKTFAYLLPVLLAQGRRVVIATAKRQLQDQIVAKDLPALQRALGADAARALGGSRLATALKGKGNYACREAAASIIAKEHAGYEAPYAAFLRRSPYGDRADYGAGVPRWWPLATAEDCVGKRCESFDDCGYVRLKRDASQSKIVVVNHHVLGADMFHGLGKMVGGPYDTLIVDEAHALAAGIRSAFTWRVAEDSIQSLADLIRRTSHHIPAVRRLAEPWERMFSLIEGRAGADVERAVPVFDQGSAIVALESLREIDAELARVEKLYADPQEPGRAPALEDAPPSVVGIEDAEMNGREERVQETRNRELGLLGQARRRVEGLVRGLSAAQGIVEDPADEELDAGAVEMRRQRILANTVVYSTQDERGRLGINAAPVGVGGIASKYFAQLKSAVLCSATLAIDGGFDHVTSMIGVTPSHSEVLPSSFNYDAMGFVYVPRDLPVVGRQHPDHADVLRRRVERAVRLCELSEGGAFVLTTANDELDAFAEAMKRRFPGRAFAQGHRRNPWDGDAPTALAKFREAKDAVLVGSKSFWEGVDVPGGALRLVIMAKLPFPQYGDPIVRARERIAGESAFRDVQLVDMLIDLRQGVGRLIRTRDDRGCVAILDSRAWDKSYGGAARRALPWSNGLVTSDLAVPERYLPRFAAHFRRGAA